MFSLYAFIHCQIIPPMKTSYGPVLFGRSSLITTNIHFNPSTGLFSYIFLICFGRMFLVIMATFCGCTTEGRYNCSKLVFLWLHLCDIWGEFCSIYIILFICLVFFLLSLVGLNNFGFRKPVFVSLIFFFPLFVIYFHCHVYNFALLWLWACLFQHYNAVYWDSLLLFWVICFPIFSHFLCFLFFRY